MKSKETLEERYIRMSLREAELRRQGYLAVAGVDEAGRGPLAGPVAVGVCILHPEQQILSLNDSKKLSAAQRADLSLSIKELAAAYGIGFADAELIDTIGINAAIRQACASAFAALSMPADYALFDYVSWDLPMSGEKIKKGDSVANCIAAASILAKTARDEYMLQQDAVYPDYAFARHMGYGTALHREKLLELGPCPIHRRSFIAKILNER